MRENSKYHVSISIVYILAASIGMISVGCKSIDDFGKQQFTQSTNTIATKPPIDRTASSPENQSKPKPKIDAPSKNFPVNSITTRKEYIYLCNIAPL